MRFKFTIVLSATVLVTFSLRSCIFSFALKLRYNLKFWRYFTTFVNCILVPLVLKTFLISREFLNRHLSLISNFFICCCLFKNELILKYKLIMCKLWMWLLALKRDWLLRLYPNCTSVLPRVLKIFDKTLTLNINSSRLCSR